MRRKFILLDPDPSGAAGGGAGDQGKEKEKPATPPTAADTGAGGKTAKEIALEKKVSTLEDEQNTIKGQLKAAQDWIAEQVKAKPAPAKGENVLDEVNTFLGWGAP